MKQLMKMFSNARLRGSGRSGGRSPGPSEDNGGPTQPPSSQHLARSPAPAPAVPHTSGSGSIPQVSLPPADPASGDLSTPLPAWLHRDRAKHIVKGNFMTLSARPKTVEQGEWIAHQGEFCLWSQRPRTSLPHTAYRNGLDF